MKFVQPLIATLALSFALLFFPPTVNNVRATENVPGEELFLSGTKDGVELKAYLNVPSIVLFKVEGKPLRYFELNAYLFDTKEQRQRLIVSSIVTDCSMPGSYMSLSEVSMFPGAKLKPLQFTDLNSSGAKILARVCSVPVTTEVPTDNLQVLVTVVNQHNAVVLSQ